MAKSHEIFSKLDILLALMAEPVRIELKRVCEALQVILSSQASSTIVYMVY